eukprot:202290-Chlamydomonas_euryale.AAC.3
MRRHRPALSATVKTQRKEGGPQPATTINSLGSGPHSRASPGSKLARAARHIMQRLPVNHEPREAALQRLDLRVQHRAADDEEVVQPGQLLGERAEVLLVHCAPAGQNTTQPVGMFCCACPRVRWHDGPPGLCCLSAQRDCAEISHSQFPRNAYQSAAVPGFLWIPNGNTPPERHVPPDGLLGLLLRINMSTCSHMPARMHAGKRT